MLNKLHMLTIYYLLGLRLIALCQLSILKAQEKSSGPYPKNSLMKTFFMQQQLFGKI